MLSSYLLACGTWQSQQGNALPRQETASKEQLGDSGHVLRAVAARAAQLWVAGVSLSHHQNVPEPAQVALRGHRCAEKIIWLDFPGASLLFEGIS